MLLKRVVWLSVIAALLVLPVIQAAETDLRRAEIRINHRAKTYMLRSWQKDDVETKVRPLDNPQPFVLKPGEKVKIFVDDPNPFLYSYSWVLGDATSTSNAEAVNTFSQGLLTVINTLEPPSSGGSTASLDSGRRHRGQVVFASFRQAADQANQVVSSAEVLEDTAIQIQSIPVVEEDMSGMVTVQRLINEAVLQVRLRKVPTPREEIRTVLKEAGIVDSEKFLKDFKADLARFYLWSAQTKKLVQQVEDGQGDAAKQTVKSWALAELAKEISDGYDLMRRASDTLVTRVSLAESNRGRVLEKEKAQYESTADRLEARLNGGKLGPGERLADLRLELSNLRRRVQELEDEIAKALSGERLKPELPTDPFFLSTALALTQETATRESLDGMKQFMAVMAKVNEPVELATVTYDGVRVNHGKVKVSKTQSFPDGINFVREKNDVGFYNLDFKPYSAYQLGVGAALIFSFVEKHEFETFSTADGKFRIIDGEEDDYEGTNLAAMMTIVPSRWADSDFHPLFEIGVKPEDDLGIYAGFGVRFSNIFSFGVGAAFEQVDQLEGNLRVNDIIDTKEALKTEKRFEPGVYLHFTASIGMAGNN